MNDMDRLRDHVTAMGFTITDEDFDTLQYLPTINFNNLCNWFPEPKVKTYDELYQAWGREGFLQFQPYTSYVNHVWVLTVRHNQHVGMWRHGYFDTCMYPTGDVPVYAGTLYLEEINEVTDAVPLYFWAALLAVTTKYPAIHDILKSKNQSVLEGFLHNTVKENYQVNIHFSWDELFNNFDYQSSMRLPKSGDALINIKQENMLLCEVSVVSDKLYAQYQPQYAKRPGVMSFTMPTEIDPAIKGAPETPLVWWISLLLSVIGICMNWQTCYAVKLKSKTCAPIKASNYPVLASVSTLNSLNYFAQGWLSGHLTYNSTNE